MGTKKEELSQPLHSIVVKEEYSVQEEESLITRIPENHTNLIQFEIIEMNPPPNMEHQRIRCLICDTTFWTYDSFRGHMKIHIEESTRYQCVYCCQCILSLDSLVAHLQEHTEGLTTNTMNQQHIINSQLPAFHPPPLQQQLLKKTEEKLFECAFCTDKFTKKSYMSVHMKQVHKRVKVEKKVKYKSRPSLPDQWKANIQKKMRNTGQDYVTRSGKVVPSRVLKPPCKSCRFQCTEKISEEARKKLFEKFWGLGNLQAQRHYVHKLMEIIEHPDRRRKHQNNFNIVHNGVTHRVCKKFFSNTFCISEKFIRTINAKSNDGVLEGEKRGFAGATSKRSANIKQPIVDFINQIPRHQQRCKSGQIHDFVDGGKTVLDFYKDFKSLQEAKGAKFGSYDTFRSVFQNDYNISLSKSKKARCDVCERKKKPEAQVSQVLPQDLPSHSVFGQTPPSEFPSAWVAEINAHPGWK